MSTQYEVFGNDPICKYSGIEYDQGAGGHDMTCRQYKSNLIFFLSCKM